MNSENVRFGSSEYKKMSVEERLAVLEDVVKAILPSKKETEPQPKQNEDDLGALMEKAETREAIIICYRKLGKQAKTTLQENLRKWGVPFGSWFKGGNFKNRLVDGGILVEDGEDDNGKKIYTLSIRGRKMADELLQKLKADMTSDQSENNTS